MITIVSSARGGELSPVKEVRGQSFNRQTLTAGLLEPCSVSEADSENKLTQKDIHMIALTSQSSQSAGVERSQRRGKFREGENRRKISKHLLNICYTQGDTKLCKTCIKNHSNGENVTTFHICYERPLKVCPNLNPDLTNMHVNRQIYANDSSFSHSFILLYSDIFFLNIYCVPDTLLNESPLDNDEIKAVNRKGNQP